MKSNSEISRCKCPRCVAARRVQLVVIIAIGIIAGCSAYLAFDLSRFKQIVLRNHSLPPLDPSGVAIETHPFAPPATQQNRQAFAKPSPQQTVSAAPLDEPSPAPLQTAAAESSPLDNVTRTQRIAKEHENSGTPVPKTGEPPAIAQMAGSHQHHEAEASIPPPPAETPAPLKSPTKERGGGTEIAQDLRRFAADYLW